MDAATSNLGAQCGSDSALPDKPVAEHTAAAACREKKPVGPAVGINSPDLEELPVFEPFPSVLDFENNGFLPKTTVKKPSKMADPFEVRMRFTSQLQHLNASVTSAQKAAQYALKYKDMDEDLHSCILEQLERNNMNTRANIMYFIEHFLEMAQKDGHVDYVRMMQRDIIRVVDAVAPDDGTGAANVKVVRKVLQGLQQKSFLQAQTVTEIDEILRERDTSAHDVSMSSPVNGDANLGDMPPSQTIPKPNRGPAPQRLDKKQIEQRIEEDRERHKRLREGIWAVPTDPKDAEMWKLFEETSDLGDDDYLMAEEEEAERQRCLQQSCPHRQAEADSRANGKHSH